jgi:hypothetical protein
MGLSWRTYVVQRCTMHSHLYHLDGRVVADIHGCVRWEWYLWEAECARVGSFAGTGDLEHWYHGKRHVLCSTIRSVSPESQVDVEESCCVTLEPAWLESYSSTKYWPCCSVRRCGHTTACEDMLVGYSQYFMSKRGI